MIVDDRFSLLQALHDGGISLLLSDRNERCYKTAAQNWENFEVSQCITSPEVTLLSFNPHHHFSSFRQAVPTNFFYFPFANTWITHQEYSPRSTVGSMNIYDNCTIVPRDDIIFSTENIINLPQFDQELTKKIIDYVRLGRRFKVIISTTDSSITISSRVDLMMINEEGEYSINIQPCYGLPASILDPYMLQQFLATIVQKYNASKPEDHPLWGSSPEEVHHGLLLNRALTAAVQVDFKQNSIHRFLRPGLMPISLNLSSESESKLSMFVNHSELDYEKYDISISSCILQVIQ